MLDIFDIILKTQATMLKQQDNRTVKDILKVAS